MRYEIEENEKLSKFIFNKNGDILVESDKDDKVISRLARGFEVVAADVADDGYTAGFDGTSRYHYVVDEQGSTVLISDKNQNIKNE